MSSLLRRTSPSTPSSGETPSPAAPPSSAEASGPTNGPAHRVRAPQATASLGAAALAGVVIWVLAVPVAGLPLEVVAAGRTVGPLSIVVAALLPGGAAWLLLLLLARFRRGPATWTWCGLAVLLLSLAGPPLSGATGAVLVVLETMHVAVGGLLLLGLRRSLGTPGTGRVR